MEKDIVKGDTLRIQGDISHIREAFETMQLLPDDLLELSRIGRLVNPAEEVHLSELDREPVKLIAGQIAERGVQVDLHPNLPIVYEDRSRLEVHGGRVWVESEWPDQGSTSYFTLPNEQAD